MSTDVTTSQRANQPVDTVGTPWWLTLHPVLAGTTTVLALWSGNVVDTPIADGLRLTAIVAGASLALWLLLTIGLRRRLSASALVATPIILIFTLVGWLTGIVGSTIQLAIVGASCVAALFVAGLLTPVGRRRASIFATVVLGALVVSNGALVWLTQPEATTTVIGAGALEPGTAIASAAVVGDQRDVWIIIPDRYTNLGALARRGLDGSQFTNDLEGRGFDVLPEATSNYPQTLLSLASAWNFELYDAQGQSGPAVGRSAIGAIDNHLLGQQFKARGYEYLHVGPWTDITAAPAVADQVLSLNQDSELARAWIEKTAVKPALDLRGWDFDVDGRQRRNALHQLAVLDDLAAAPPNGPKLVMAHLILPHEPYVFAPGGGAPEPGLGEVEGFDQQRQYVDERLLTLVDELQARDEPPLIVIAADEGIYPEDWDGDIVATYDWSPISPDVGRDKLAILAAVYDPDPPSDEAFPLTDDMSLVNIMRWLANRSLDADFDRLPDDHYLYRTTGWQELGLVDLDGETLD